MGWYLYPLTVLAGMAAGFINVLAGSGSLITLPLLIFIGLPANIANATNRIGVLLQNVVGVSGFYRRGKLDVRGSLWLAVPMILGSIVGARIAVDINEALLRKVIAVVMLIMLAIMIVEPKRWLVGKGEGWHGRLSLSCFLLFFAIGIYGGFLQAGVGIFLLAGLVLGAGYDIVRANAVKVAIVLASALVSLVVFSVSLDIDWGVGILLGAGNMIGAWLATHFAADKGAEWVHRFVIVVVLASAAHLLGVFDWMAGIILH